MLKVLFVLIIMVWCFTGFFGVVDCKSDKVNWKMLFFIFFAPFLPLIAKACGL